MQQEDLSLINPPGFPFRRELRGGCLILDQGRQKGLPDKDVEKLFITGTEVELFLQTLVNIVLNLYNYLFLLGFLLCLYNGHHFICLLI
ncbi:MAG: hypothetical protein DRG50_04020 [Deltaproteobacteria bacterium]|nr:MAG: hypothetical protein DRG50_04020 [Deltaproteobacteria bacterium]